MNKEAKRKLPTPVTARTAANDQPDLRVLYRTMYQIRRVEESLGELFKAAEVYGALHLCIGQEATVTGACAALHQDDYITATYRGHGATLAT
jgi:pyruvate dehydrogenase E1 component alpha subunit